MLSLLILLIAYAPFIFFAVSLAFFIMSRGKKRSGKQVRVVFTASGIIALVYTLLLAYFGVHGIITAHTIPSGGYNELTKILNAVFTVTALAILSTAPFVVGAILFIAGLCLLIRTSIKEKRSQRAFGLTISGGSIALVYIVIFAFLR